MRCRLSSLAITDPFLGGYSPATPVVYASFLISVWIGTRLRKSESPLVIGAAALVGSVQFFLITNFAAWLDPRIGYAPTFQGLLTSYTMAVRSSGAHWIGPAVHSRSVRSARVAQPYRGASRACRRPSRVKTLLAWSRGKIARGRCTF